MDPYNYEQVQAVWQRVLEQQSSPTLRSELEEMIAGEYAAAMGYEKLAKQNRRYAPMLSAIARDERRHAHRLTELYRLQWEHSPRIASGVAREALPFSSAIRAAYGEELAAAKNYRAAAKKWPQHGPLFLSISSDEQRHSQILHRISRNLP